MVTLSISKYYTTYPIVLINGTEQRYNWEFTTGDEVEIRFKKLSGFTYTEGFTLDGASLTITGLEEGETSDGYHYLKFTGDAEWDSKTLLFSIDIADRSNFKTVTASGSYDGSAVSITPYVVVDNDFYYTYLGAVPAGATICIQATSSLLDTGIAFDKLNASSVGIADTDITKVEWTYNSINSKYGSSLYVYFVMPNSDVTAILDLKAETIVPIIYYVDGSQYQQPTYAPEGGFIGDARANYILVKTPSKEGYTFDGWFIDAEFIQQATANTEIPAEETGLNLYAKFTSLGSTYTVTFKNGLITVDTVEVEEGTAIPSADIPTVTPPTGMEFNYWADEDNNEFDFDTLITEDITLYAKFKVSTYTVTFKEGDTTIKTVEVAYNHTVSYIDPQHMTDASGKEFMYWVDSNSQKFDFTTPITEDITLTAYYAQAGSSKWIMSLPNCFVGLKADIDYLPIARVDDGTKALALSETAGEETAYIFHKASLTWIELQHYTVMI